MIIKILILITAVILIQVIANDASNENVDSNDNDNKDTNRDNDNIDSNNTCDNHKKSKDIDKDM